MTAAFPPLWGLMPAPPIHLRTWQNRTHVTKGHTLWLPVFIKRIFLLLPILSVYSPLPAHLGETFQILPAIARHHRRVPQHLHPPLATQQVGSAMSEFSGAGFLERWVCYATQQAKCDMYLIDDIFSPWAVGRSLGLVISIWDKQLEGYDGFVSYQALFYSRFL